MNRLQVFSDITHNTGDVGSYSYTYDRYGNRLTQTVTSGSGPSPSTPVSTANNNQLSGMSYDAAGNQLSDGTNSYTYDAEGNVTAVNSGNTGQYVYDALNHRVSSKTSAGTYEYLFDAQGRRTSTWLASSNFGVEGRIYWDKQQIAYRALNGQTFFEHKDYLGTERFRTNYQGARAATENSLAFGDGFNQTVSLTDGDQDNDQYAGLDYDSESATQHAQFRQYSSTQGRWMSPDPYDGSYDMTNPQSLNRYSYVANNPVGLTDPLGTDYTDPAGDPCYTEPTTTSGNTMGVGTQCYTYGPPSPGQTNVPWYISEYGGTTCGYGGGSYPACPTPGPTRKGPSSAPNNQTPIVPNQQRHNNCVASIVTTGIGVATTVGAGVVIAVAAPEIATAAAAEGAEAVTAAAAEGLVAGGGEGASFMAFVHGFDAVGHLLVAPLFAIGAGVNGIIANCGNP